MECQLSFFTDLPARTRVYTRDRSGRFATKEQRTVDEAKRSVIHYKLLYEAEQRKLRPILKRLIAVERELTELKAKHKPLIEEQNDTKKRYYNIHRSGR